MALGLGQGWDNISIHAPREGCDAQAVVARSYRTPYFNPRTPRGVRRAAPAGEESI